MEVAMGPPEHPLRKSVGQEIGPLTHTANFAATEGVLAGATGSAASASAPGICGGTLGNDKHAQGVVALDRLR